MSKAVKTLLAAKQDERKLEARVSEPVQQQTVRRFVPSLPVHAVNSPFLLSCLLRTVRPNWRALSLVRGWC